MMGKVVLDISMSLDGFITARNDEKSNFERRHPHRVRSVG